ncbi:hypothetical protein [Rivihabitans pingtungensis]|uniref:hypothetical protein n=1 Tax=Rivihabitans pingtungensis TaxID=1054498 RepID=UPI0023532171|nr:hypothetical protein [Rivihabitans pingtungensis]MCK6436205.1 hypothetical protein [Rivihabitans pingtungensis]
MTDFIHYVARHIKKINHNKNTAWFRENQPDDQGFNRPAFHTTRRTTGPAARIKPGDTIWIFSQLKSPWGNLFPSLDAKIVVEQVTKEDGKLRYVAGQTSLWFPLFDATSVLKKIQTKSSKGDVSPLLRGDVPVGVLLRNIREVFDNSPIIELEETINNSGLYFISYRIVDGTRLAFNFCRNLSKCNIPIFWDRWSLPRRLVERREKVSNTALDNYLKDIIKSPRCLKVYGINSPQYNAPYSYAQEEKATAKEHDKFIEII